MKYSVVIKFCERENGRYPYIGEKKTADYLHRTATTVYPCCLPTLGEFNRSWSCKTCRGAKIVISFEDCGLLFKDF